MSLLPILDSLFIDSDPGNWQALLFGLSGLAYLLSHCQNVTAHKNPDCWLFIWDPMLMGRQADRNLGGLN